MEPNENLIKDELAQYLSTSRILNKVIASKEDAMETTEFAILSMMLDHQSITNEEIKVGLDLDSLIDNVLDWLRANNLIERNGNAWSLTKSLLDRFSAVEPASAKQEGPNEISTLRRTTTEDTLEKIMSGPSSSSLVDRTKLRQEARKSQIEDDSKPISPSQRTGSGTDIDSLFDDVLDESMDDLLKDFEDVQIVTESGKPVLGGPIIDILTDQGYIKDKLSTEEELLAVPEYEILSTIVKNHPISAEDIEKITKSSSVSMVLSNLQADDLIKYTNDYQWTISEKVFNILKEHIGRQKEDKQDEIQYLKSLIEKGSAQELQFRKALFKLKYIPSLELDMEDCMNIPEFKVLKIIKDNEPTDIEFIKKQTQEIQPVHLTRMIARLTSDNHILQSEDGSVQLAYNFVKILVDRDE